MTIGNIRSLPRLTERPFSGPALTQRFYLRWHPEALYQCNARGCAP
jgi:hypothetical protein